MSQPAASIPSIALLILAILSLGGCAIRSTHEQTTAFTLPHQPGTGLSITTRNGAIIIRQANSPQVSIEARLIMTSTARLEGTTISANRAADGTLKITAIPPDGRWLSREGCSFEVHIPDTTSVDVRTGNGRIEVADLAGPATLNTSNGRIIVENHDGDVSAETSNGAVRIIDAAGRIRIRTSNGAITARPAPENHGPLDLRTSNGRITIELPTEFAGRLDLRTSNGSIRIDDALAARLHRSGRSSATVSLGDGTAQSQIRTSNGAITIEASPTSRSEAETGSTVGAGIR